ncbi:MAG: YheT family hydrolase [Luteolibacter sp.]
MKTVTIHKDRLELEDGDFLDLAWSGKSGERLAVLSHGLEGSFTATYIQGMAAVLMKRGWDVLVWNFRGCGEEMNRLPSFYHSGKTEDLELVIRHAMEAHPATKIDLLGFSLGGNLTLKYVGERGSEIDSRISGAVAFSVPCDLADSSAELSKPKNRIYMERFLKSLRTKVKAKDAVFPGVMDLKGVDEMKSFAEFDNRFTAPLHGFESAEDYWIRSSCRQFLGNVFIPTLLVNAVNDPILGSKCYPKEEAENSEHFYLENPLQGGHVGFGTGEEYWSEKRAVEFLGGS